MHACDFAGIRDCCRDGRAAPKPPRQQFAFEGDLARVATVQFLNGL
jgi:hypothetical protein